MKRSEKNQNEQRARFEAGSLRALPQPFVPANIEHLWYKMLLDSGKEHSELFTEAVLALYSSKYNIMN